MKNVTYVFKKIRKESSNLFLKTALWNIGAKKCKSEKLLFIDSDIVFFNADWILKASNALDLYDVISIAGQVKYENQCQNSNFIDSIGKSIQISNNQKNDGHVGFTIGMTRKAYDLYGMFEAFSCPGDDTWIWTHILGSKFKIPRYGWMAYSNYD